MCVRQRQQIYIYVLKYFALTIVENEVREMIIFSALANSELLQNALALFAPFGANSSQITFSQNNVFDFDRITQSAKF